MERILLPLDLGDDAHPAMPHAVALTERMGAELHLLHVVTDPPEPFDEMIGFPEMEEYCTRMRTDALQCHQAIPAHRPTGPLALRTAVRRHPEAARAILDYADDHRISMIVMAPYGRRRREQFVVGSTAGKVARLASCDVLTSGFRGLYQPHVLRRILVPVDFSPASAHALARARALAHQARAHLTVLHVIETTVFPAERPGIVSVRGSMSHDEAYAHLELFYQRAKGPDVPHLLCVMRGRPLDRIAAFSDRHDVHLIVQGSRGRSGMEYATMGSMAEALVRRAACPVLTVKMPPQPLISNGTRAKEPWRREERSPTHAVHLRNTKLGVSS